MQPLGGSTLDILATLFILSVGFTIAFLLSRLLKYLENF